MLNVASGAMNDIQDTTTKMKELSVEAANGIYTDQDKQNIQQEYNQLAQHLEDVYENTQYNGKPLFQNDQMTLQSGPNAGDTQTIDIPNLGEQIQALTKVNLATNAQDAIKTIDNTQLSVSSAQSTVGSIQNNLDEQTNNLMVSYENMVASQSQIVDADMAKEMIQETTDKIKSTASIYSVINFKNTTLAYMESLLSG
jgi:flagellin